MKKLYQTDFATYSNRRIEPYFSFVKNGQKTIEGRLHKEEYKLLKIGDHIIVQSREESDSAEIVVGDIRKYHSFQEMLQNEDLKKVLPEVETIEEGVAVYRKFYTDEEQEEFGVIAIQFNRL
jgi:ASC-1-like (ASCH) protein